MSLSHLAKDMDKNTRYFHNIASARRRNNRVDALEESPIAGFRDGLVDMIAEEDAATLEEDEISYARPGWRTQSAFVKGWKIHDGALIACETVQWLKLRKKPAAIIKLDFQKAYDRVKWSCRHRPAEDGLWVKVEGMGMIGEAVRNGKITPLFVGRDNIELSYLQFADDTVLFYLSEEETIKNYMRLLRCFELMLGLSINFDKSSLIPINCEQQRVRSMCSLLGCKEANLLLDTLESL
ncbi:uncharacterized protein LOC130939407 [Arachis stenosperma]|uniref:uncharacterized protein LOC130939407 n=1 Tax=Arachis stenosperma TaxID=217475 RepID=UPI0025AC9AE1|nr:uncharacterized protein LOC130939407 [Arachis stenosperma]